MKNQSAEGLSIYFLAQWFCGDTLNLLGCLLQGEQLATTKALSMYFIIADVLMLTQFLYYGALNQRKAEAARKLALRKSTYKNSRACSPAPINQHPHEANGQVVISSQPATSSHPISLTLHDVSHDITPGRAGCAEGDDTTTMPAPASQPAAEPQGSMRMVLVPPTPGARTSSTALLLTTLGLAALLTVLGSAFGYCSMVLYLTSRLSQIYKNWSRKSAEGLSVIMFVFTISANLCTGCSMLLRSRLHDCPAPQLPSAYPYPTTACKLAWPVDERRTLKTSKLKRLGWHARPHAVLLSPSSPSLAVVGVAAITYNAVESLAHAAEAGRVTAASAAAMAGLPAALQPRRTSQFRYQKLPEQC
ncbi:hypothetical protein V8C86DRAFT_2433049 [Haematococcus lacustris]